METVAPPSKGIDFQQVFKYLFIAIIAGLALYGLYRLVKLLAALFYENKRTLPTPENNARIAAEQIKLYEPMYMNKGNQPQADVAAPLDREENAFINLNVLGAMNAGYVGPNISGVFAEEDAVRIAMRAGCRAFFLPVDKLENSNAPVLVVRSAGGDKISNNTGSIERVCTAIASLAPPTDTIIIVLYVRKLPSANPYDPASLQFMMDIGAQLAPLKSRHLGLTSEGDYRRQKMQDTLFLRPPSELEGRFIVLTNVDTKGFREGTLPSLPKGLTPGNDLDLWTHARIYTATAEEEKPKTSGPELETDDYYMGIPDNKLPDAIARSKVNWQMNLPAATPVVKPTVDAMMDKIGVTCFFTDIFTQDTKGLTAAVFTDKLFAKSGFRLKPADLRYKRPAAMQLSAPSKQLDTKGGFIEVKKTM